METTTTTKPAQDIRSQAQSKLPDFLLAEYMHMCESFLRNEESGEKRAAFFVTIVGAAGGILGFVFGEKTSFPRDQKYLASATVAAVLLCFGFLTVRRLIKRDIETDRIKFALRSLRRLFLTKKEAEELPNAFYGPYEAESLRSVTWRSIGNGGWMHTVSFVNALLTAVFIFAACHTREWGLTEPWQKVIALVLALAGGAIVWIRLLNYASSTITKKQEKLIQNDPLEEALYKLQRCSTLSHE